MGNLMDWFYGQIVGFLGNFFAIMGMMGAVSYTHLTLPTIRRA